MYEYDDEVLDTFLKKQTQLFSEEVADTPEAAEEFLESDDELMDQSEVFAIEDGRFLVVEG